jgi:tetratricopeptide (TPR) repeat protein
MMRKILLMMMFFLALPACDTKSKATPYADLTLAERARIALDAKDFPEAINLYAELVAAEPDNYEAYRFLSAAYAEEGGFDLLKAVTATLDANSSSLLDTISKFLPTDPTEHQINSIQAATETLMRLPAEQRSHEHPEISGSSSGAQQLEFYQTAYSVIYINKFAKITDQGTLDPSRLETMTDEDVDNILENFESIATESGSGVISEAAEEFISQLDATPGETRRDKLLNYLATHSG